MITMLNVLSIIKINPLLWGLGGLGIVTGHFRELIILFSVILIHELGHAITAAVLKWRLVKIELLPFGGVAEMDEYGNRPYHEELLVILAGPFQHVWMLAVAKAGLNFGIGDPHLLEMLVSINWMILLFNLLPIWPLDGGKLLFLLSTVYLPFRKAKRWTILVSATFLILFFIVSLTLYSFNLNLVVILLFLLYAHYIEWKHQSYVYLRFLLERFHLPASFTKKRVISVSPDLRVDHVLNHFYKGYEHDILVKASPPYMCKEKELLSAYFKNSAVSCAIHDLFR
ncbi:M50 family metallopeptidase [Alkalihalobacillus sp. AL-G]|uniref:M50 family metallopeptidase n=1 Tax=Alkalihalobacillus sp. AL-G TaxID=2926399 RepID=UPI00272CCD08|nr:M50 family metallopeptidase [Alkalihalobacillus sp. AL-G]WLD92234.1 M50 family metallopeptidase [Alkalihalobacillus sp. AL-G]